MGQDPLVIQPVHAIGKYGGIWRRGFTGPADFANGYRCCSGTDHSLFWDDTGEKVVPNLARGWALRHDGRTLTLHLRRGMQWSDGPPFTAQDFMCWFAEMDQHKALGPTPSATMMRNGKPGELVQVDTYTVQFPFPAPDYLLPDVLAGTTHLGGQAWQGRSGMGGFAPAHDLQQYHPKDVARDAREKKAREARFDNWGALFKDKNDWALTPALPVVTPWKTVTPITTPPWVLERTPESIWVDTAGHQLPYIDTVVMTLAENLEGRNLRAIAGEYDLAGTPRRSGQGPGLSGEPGKGRLQALARPRRRWRRYEHQMQPQL
jgi:peptide/nickel transport system substrate-binding protein